MVTLGLRAEGWDTGRGRPERGVWSWVPEGARKGEPS